MDTDRGIESRADRPVGHAEPGRLNGAALSDTREQGVNSTRGLFSFCDRVHDLAATAGGIAADKHSVSFQSRLAGEPWLSPFTDYELKRLPKVGKKRLLVICPAFVADCLETIEEISEEGRDDFMAAGGESFQQIPCLNDQKPYIEFLAQRVGRWLDHR